MKNRKAKKGFTIIELVIVIAVIGILAGVLIPTFSNVIANANKTAAMEEAKNAYTAYLADNAANITMNGSTFVIESKDFYFKVTDGQFAAEAVAKPASGNVVIVEKGAFKADSIAINATTGVIEAKGTITTK